MHFNKMQNNACVSYQLKIMKTCAILLFLNGTHDRFVLHTNMSSAEADIDKNGVPACLTHFLIQNCLL